MKGTTTPATPLPAHIVPYAMPFREMNHSSRYNVVGLNRSPLPMAQSTPCGAMSCHTCMAKEDRIRLPTVSARPMGPQYGRSRGYRVRKVKVRGIMRYMIPVRDVPIVAMAL